MSRPMTEDAILDLDYDIKLSSKRHPIMDCLGFLSAMERHGNRNKD